MKEKLKYSQMKAMKEFIITRPAIQQMLKSPAEYNEKESTQ